MRTPKPFDRARFWAKVDATHTDSCWRWTGATAGIGHGKLWVGSDPFTDEPHRKYEYAHRVAWALGHCRWPEAGLVIRHLCDVPACCNPAHLVESTQAENCADRAARSNWAGYPKLSPEDVRAIRHSPKTQQALARDYGTSQVAISNIRARKTYKWVTDVAEQVAA